MSFELNENQKQAVNHPNSPLLVLAGPGSGKTSVITERVIHLVNQGFKSNEILCLTFSEKAAEEMKQRLEKQIDVTDMEISTFHSFARQILEDNVLDSGIGMSSGVLKRSSQLVWGLKNIDSFDFEHLEVGNNTVEIIESIIDGISTFKDELITPDELDKYINAKLKDTTDEDQMDFLLKLKDLAKVYHKYQEFQRGKAVIDFDDMVVQAIQLFKSKQNVLAKYQKKFKHVLVDEFQDNNYAQLELVKQIAQKGNVTVVGDDDQSIYRFQGAYLTNFQDYTEFYKNSNKITLNQNYRSTQNIVKLASELLQNIPHRESKNLFSKNEKGEKITVATCKNEAAEVEFVVKTINDLIGKSITRRDNKDTPITYKDIVVLSRRKHEGKKFTKALKAHGIPTTFVGESNIFSSPIIRDLVAFLRITDKPGESGIEITRLMKSHGITEHNIAKLNQVAKKKARDDDTSIDFVLESMQNSQNIDITQPDEVKELCEQLQRVIDLEKNNAVSDIVYKIMMSESDLYKRTLSQNTLQNKRDQLLLQEIYNISIDYESLNPHGTLGDFIDYLDLMGKFDIELSEGAELENAVRVTTIHQSKGKEFPFVFIVDVATNRLPLKYQAKEFFVPNDLSKGVKRQEDEKELYKQEERRLFYVAMTRAQNQLFITHSKIYGQNIRETKQSAFLDEINYKENPLVNFVEYESQLGDVILQEEDRIDRLKQEIQDKAIKSLNQMNLKTAIQRIIELAKIKYFQENKSTKGFDSSIVLKIINSDDTIEAFLENKKIPLINKEDLHLSASSVKTYKECPLKFKFGSVLNVPSKRKTYFDLGSAVHAVAEHLTKQQKDGIAPTEKLAFDILEKEWNSNAYESKTKEKQDYELAKTMVQTYLDWTKNNPNTPIDVEKKFKIEIGNIPFIGYIDRVEITPDGEYEVVDFKTGYDYENKSSIKKDYQMNIYALGVEHVYGKLPKKASLFYLKHKKLVPYEIDKEQVNEIKSLIEENVNSILSEEFEPTPGYQVCKWCDYQPICDAKEIEE